MNRWLWLSVAAMLAFSGCDDKDDGAAASQENAPAQEAALRQADLAKNIPAAASLTHIVGGTGAQAAAPQGDPGRFLFDGQVSAYANSGGGGVFAGAPRSFGPRPRIQYTSVKSNAASSDLALPAPPFPSNGGRAARYAGLRAALISRGSDPGLVDESIRTSLQKGMDPLLTLAIGSQESGLRNNVTSPVGARGGMQLMPDTACGMGVCRASALYNPTVNVGLGTTYFRSMLRQFGRVDLALAAYNAGPGAVQKYGGVPPYAETQDYVRQVLRYYRRYRRFLSRTQTA